ncbi:DUF6215 domain-containing protein [Streptomyces europaeiscabiei]|uniref:DUF6215 domain-containing protein n=1 Tax=Streptomyces europaeiscabiei TaxID=146819 RepID=UPI0029A31DC0|nr:DUF6215 domain-containing protein [Streptomyces europaeiscabiei]MDX3667114.1 DUF6215 domain-containing protein [Streptomyces europaeiscabiei]MDX3710936.1 DUF6215 domain-containing protein [Streptomyces europaeiscabiei]MDX3863086.1 DUF6215 domain-containing protein [Streptomyces europaeiscabiei]MDX3871822.1 DUF6215 domain-containing protein [Streptomyces europaeiscabiei]
MSTGAQVFSAVATVGVLLGGMWLLGDLLGQTPGTVGPAVCSSSDDASPAPRGKVSGAQLCTALNRSDLPGLLGTPTEQAVSASGGESESSWASSGTKTVTPEATVTLDTYTVELSASYEDLPVTDSVGYLGADAETRTVLGRPAVLYSGQTIAISFGLDGSDPQSGPGGVARRLLVATDPKDSGSTFELVIWRQDSQRPDDEALFRVAEKVLPTIPDWKPAG